MREKGEEKCVIKIKLMELTDEIKKMYVLKGIECNTERMFI